MKIIRFFLLSVFALPVCAAAQATYSIPLGNGFGWDTKIPITFNQEEFNKKFAEKMNAVRASYALQAAPAAKALPPTPPAARPDEANDSAQDHTQCIICREKILKTDGYQITPKRDWYVKKHSPCACQFYKGWKDSEDTSFFQTAAQRSKCEMTMDSKYATHTCAVCGKPINAACGAISSWEDSQGPHYAHADCFAWQRHTAQKEELLKNLDITEADCTRYDRQEQQRLHTQQRLVEELKAATQELSPQPQPALPSIQPAAQPQIRPLKQVKRDLNRFNRRYGKALHQAAKDRREGKTLSQKQQQLLQDFEALRAEYAQASQAAAN